MSESQSKRTTTNIRIRTTDDLFEKLSISDIAAVVAKTSAKVDAKKLELKDLVGSKYQDLLESADSVMKMYEHGNELNLCLMRIENATENVIRSISTSSTIRKRVERKENKALMEAKKIQQLIESPERIWQALDNGDLLLATSEFLCARKSYVDLKKTKNYFSLWNRRWCSMKNLPQVIRLEAVRRLNEQKSNLPAKAYADAIAVLILLSRESEEVAEWNLVMETNLTRFLKTRSRWIEDEMKSNREENSMTDILKMNKLRRLLDIVRNTIKHVSVIFSSSESLLEKRLLLVLNSISSQSSSDHTLRRLRDLFQSLEYHDDKDENNETRAWISIERTRIMCDTWLSDKVSSIQEVTERTLKSTTNIQDLATVQASLGGAQSRRSDDGLEENESEEKTNNLTPHNLWSLLFRDRFRQRMQHLLQDAFESACELVEKKVEERRRQLVAEEASSQINSSSLSHLRVCPSTSSRMICEEFDMVFGNLLEDVRVLFSNDGVLHREALGKRPEAALFRLTKYFTRFVVDSSSKTSKIFSILIARVCWTLFTESSVLRKMCPEIEDSNVLTLPSSSSSSSIEVEFSNVVRQGIETWILYVSRDAADHMSDETFSSIEKPSSSLCAALFSVASRLAQCSEGLDENSAMYREMHRGLVRESSKRLWNVWSSLCDSESRGKDTLTVDFYVMEYLLGKNDAMRKKMNDFWNDEEIDVSCHRRDAESFVSNSSLLLSSLFSSSSSKIPHEEEMDTSREENTEEVEYVAPVAPRFALLPVKINNDDEKVTVETRKKDEDFSTTTKLDDTPTKALKFVGKVVGGELFSKAKSLWRQ